MADLLDGIARYLAAEGLLTYDPAGVTGDTFVETMPPAPDRAVSLALYDAGPQQARDDDTDQRLQVRVRGGPDPRVSRARAQAIYAALHGLTGTQLPDGTWAVLIAARGIPAPMGADSNGRHEHVTNYDVATAAPTPTP
ncbi:minor capsid protein [Streptomyces sp. NBC_01268]|uniref:minor capsid protein n=1 Tax=Streptomyces sp. NBC_01268 TaxID=2903806 RepID=UPI002E305432|nr:minor capsid protein [Streptomyces sp. NBC_01268]